MDQQLNRYKISIDIGHSTKLPKKTKLIITSGLYSTAPLRNFSKSHASTNIQYMYSTNGWMDG